MCESRISTRKGICGARGRLRRGAHDRRPRGQALNQALQGRALHFAIIDLGRVEKAFLEGLKSLFHVFVVKRVYQFASKRLGGGVGAGVGVGEGGRGGARRSERAKGTAPAPEECWPRIARIKKARRIMRRQCPLCVALVKVDCVRRTISQLSRRTRSPPERAHPKHPPPLVTIF